MGGIVAHDTCARYDIGTEMVDIVSVHSLPKSVSAQVENVRNNGRRGVLRKEASKLPGT